MLSSLTTKIALKKVGLSSDTFNFNSWGASASEPKEVKKTNSRELAPGVVPAVDEQDVDEKSGGWPAWMTVKKLPLSVQPWLSPPPPPIPVAESPKVGDMAPMDRDKKLTFGAGKKVIVVFLRCVGCAFAQKTFLTLRSIANKHAGNVTCIAVSHSSEQATKKWLDLMGGAWNVQVVIDEDRSVYAAWGLGLGSMWYVLNPTTQVQAWKEKGWLGEKVAGAIQRSGTDGRGKASYQTGGSGVIDLDGPMTVMGNKWQTAGAWAIDVRGKIVWGGKALRADDPMDLDAGLAALGL